MKRKVIDVLAYKTESYDSDCFLKDIVSYSPNSVVIVYDPEKARVVYRPEGYNLSYEVFPLFDLKKSVFLYYIYPLWFLISFFKILFYFFRLCLKFKVRVLVVDNTYLATGLGLLRRFRLVKRFIYLAGDWLPGNKVNKRFWSFLGNEVVYPLCDLFCARSADVTLNFTKDISESRKTYWKRSVTKFEGILPLRLETKKVKEKERNKIVFLGNVRDDSGLEIAITSLKRLKKKMDVSLKIIGPFKSPPKNLYLLAKKNGVLKDVDFLGFVERENFKEVLADCFCGINVLTSSYSYTIKTMPSKLFDYLQYSLPVIVSKNLGPLSKVIEEHKLGIVINPNEEEYIKAVEKTFLSYKKYKKNLIDYINLFQDKKISDYF